MRKKHILKEKKEKVPMPKQNSGTTQVYNPKNKRYVKRDKETGQFVDMNEQENQKFPNTPVEK
jgi:hypothetical protein